MTEYSVARGMMRFVDDDKIPLPLCGTGFLQKLKRIRRDGFVPVGRKAIQFPVRAGFVYRRFGEIDADDMLRTGGARVD